MRVRRNHLNDTASTRTNNSRESYDDRYYCIASDLTLEPIVVSLKLATTINVDKMINFMSQILMKTLLIVFKSFERIEVLFYTASSDVRPHFFSFMIYTIISGL